MCVCDIPTNTLWFQCNSLFIYDLFLISIHSFGCKKKLKDSHCSCDIYATCVSVGVCACMCVCVYLWVYIWSIHNNTHHMLFTNIGLSVVYVI